MNFTLKEKLLYPSIVVLLSFSIIFLASSISYIGIALLLFTIYYGVFSVLKIDTIAGNFNLTTNKSLAFISIPLFIGFSTYICNISNNKTVYLWDQVVYWGITKDFTDLFLSDVTSGFDRLYHSILVEDYNVFPTISLLAWNKLIGASYLNWSISVYLFCILPAMLAFILVLLKAGNKDEIISNWGLLAIASWVILYPQFTAAATRGYLDGFGLLFIGILVYDFISDELTKYDWQKSLWLALVIIFLLFTRRWYAFWVVGYFIAIASTRLISLYLKEISKQQFKTAFLQIITSGLACLVVLVLFFYDFLDRALFGQYKQVLTAWQVHSLSSMLMETIGYFGYFYMAMAAMGVWFSLKNTGLRYLTIFLLTCTIIAFILFTRVQSLGMHHLYIVCPLILIESFFGIKYFFDLIIKQGRVFTKALLVSISGLFFFSIAYSHTLYDKLPLITKWVCPWSFSSQIRTDMGQLKEVISYLNVINPLTNNSAKGVYVLASSHEYNGQLFKNFNLPKTNAVNGLLSTHEVDRRDGFPINFFRSDFVAVVDPIQLHLNPEEQTTIKYLSEQLLSGSGIGKSFELINQTNMGNGKTIKIYKKTNEIDLNEIQTFSNVLKQRYPDLKYVYNFQSKDLIENIRASEAGSYVNFIDNNTLYVHPGDKEPVSFELNTMGNYSTLKFKIASPDSLAVVQNCGTRGGEINLSVFAEDSLIYNQYCTINAVQNCQLSISGKKKLKIVVDKGKNGTDCDGFQLREFELVP